MDSFASKGLCSFVMEEHCGSSCDTTMDYLVAPVGHTSGMEAVVVGTAPAGTTVDTASTVPGSNFEWAALGVGLTDLGMELAALDSEVATLDTALVVLGPELSTQVGIGNSYAPSVLVEPRSMLHCPWCLQMYSRRSCSRPFPQALRMLGPLCYGGLLQHARIAGSRCGSHSLVVLFGLPLWYSEQ